MKFPIYFFAALILLYSCAGETTTMTTETTETTETKPAVTENNNTAKKAEPQKAPAKKTEPKKEIVAKSSKEPLIVTDANFEELVLKSDKVVLIDFWAVWCGPCKRIAPYIKEFASEYDGKAVIAKVDVDKNRGIASKYRISSIPTLIIFKNGQPVDGLIGAHPKATVKEKLDKALGS